MFWLIFGVLLWTTVHLWKRLAPAHREKYGDKGKGMVALGSVAAIVMMWYGYGHAQGPVWWGRTPMMVGINNLLMLFAVYLFAASGLKTRITARIRHPQLTAVKVWAVAHLLVNGDLRSFILFGGLLAWAVMAVIYINKQQGRPAAPAPVPMSKEIIAIVAAIVVYAVIAGVHYWAGYPVFG